MWHKFVFCCCRCYLCCCCCCCRFVAGNWNKKQNGKTKTQTWSAPSVGQDVGQGCLLGGRGAGCVQQPDRHWDSFYAANINLSIYIKLRKMAAWKWRRGGGAEAFSGGSGAWQCNRICRSKASDKNWDWWDVNAIYRRVSARIKPPDLWAGRGRVMYVCFDIWQDIWHILCGHSGAQQQNVLTQCAALNQRSNENWLIWVWNKSRFVCTE